MCSKWVCSCLNGFKYSFRCTCRCVRPEKSMLDVFLYHTLLLASKLQESSCLSLPNSRITSRHHHLWYFTWVLGIWTSVLMLLQQTLSLNHTPALFHQILYFGKKSYTYFTFILHVFIVYCTGFSDQIHTDHSASIFHKCIPQCLAQLLRSMKNFPIFYYYIKNWSKLWKALSFLKSNKLSESYNCEWSFSFLVRNKLMHSIEDKILLS